jgi:hypothetical protein
MRSTKPTKEVEKERGTGLKIRLEAKQEGGTERNRGNAELADREGKGCRWKRKFNKANVAGSIVRGKGQNNEQ